MNECGFIWYLFQGNKNTFKIINPPAKSHHQWLPTLIAWFSASTQRYNWMPRADNIHAWKGEFFLMFYLYFLLCALSVDAHLKLLLKLLILLHLFIKRLKSKKKSHPGREQCKEGLPGFIRTNCNHRSDLGLQLISYKYTAPKVPGQGKSFFWKGTGTDPKSRVLMALQQIALSAHWKWEIFSCS